MSSLEGPKHCRNPVEKKEMMYAVRLNKLHNSFGGADTHRGTRKRRQRRRGTYTHGGRGNYLNYGGGYNGYNDDGYNNYAFPQQQQEEQFAQFSQPAAGRGSQGRGGVHKGCYNCRKAGHLQAECRQPRGW